MANQVKSFNTVLTAYIKSMLGLTDLNIKTINGLEFAQTIPDFITVGTAYSFASTNTSYVVAKVLTSTKVIVIYSALNNNTYGTSIILNVSGDTITAGTPFVFESASTNSITADLLTSTKVIVAYSDGGNSNYGTSIILNVDVSDVITAGTPFVFTTDLGADICVTVLTSTKVIATYREGGNSNYGTSIILNVDVSDVITAGTPVVFKAYTTTNSMSNIMLSSTKILVVYRISANSYGQSIVLNISGNTITPVTEFTFESSLISGISTSGLTSTKVIVAYSDSGNSNYGTSIILNVDVSDVITAGTPFVYVNNASNITSLTFLTATKVLLVHRDGVSPYYATSLILNVSTDTISAANPTISSTGTVGLTRSTALTATKAIVIYTDDTNSNFLTSSVLNISI